MPRGLPSAVCLSCLLALPFACHPARQATPGGAMTPVAAPALPAASALAESAPGLRYPDAPRGQQQDLYHGVSVPDPYRWLEDMDSPETRRWITAENALTAEQLAKMNARAPLERRLRELWNYERWGAPSIEGPELVVAHNDGLQNQSVLYTLGHGRDGEHERKLLLDPNAL